MVSTISMVSVPLTGQKQENVEIHFLQNILRSYDKIYSRKMDDGKARDIVCPSAGVHIGEG